MMCRRPYLITSSILLLFFVGSLSVASAATVAYWRMGDSDPAVANGALPDSDGRTVWRKAVNDDSGNGNHLTTWEYAWAGFNWRIGGPNVPAGIVPFSGASNSFSIQNAGSYPASMTWSARSLPTGTDIETITPAAFTIEASFWFNPANPLNSYSNGYHTIVGRDGMNVWTGVPANAPLYFSCRPGGAVAIEFIDVNGADHVAQSVTGLVTTGRWYSMVGVSDGSTLSLYLDDGAAGQGYKLVAQTSLTPSSDTRLAVGNAGTPMTDWSPGTWTVGRGLYNGGHVDRVYGKIDEVRISDTALRPSQFLFQTRATESNPSNGGAYDGTNVTLSWSAVSWASKHDVYFADDFNDVNDAKSTDPSGPDKVYKGRQDPNSYYVSSITRGKTYYWRIDEFNSPNIWRGDVWSFLVKPPKAWSPEPPDSADYISNDPNLSWNAGVNSTKSKVYFGTSPGSLVLQMTITHTTGVERYSYIKTGLNNNQIHYWRVDEVPSTGPDVTGDLWSFTTRPFVPITDPTLKGWWKLDDQAGTRAVDSSGYYYDGTLTNGPQWTTGLIKGALQFDGTNDYVSLPIGSLIGSLNSTTIATWVNFSGAAGSFQRIFDFGNDTDVYMLLTPRYGWTDGPLRFAITLTSWDGDPGEFAVADPDGALPTGWHHVAVVIDGASNTMELYRNGVVVASGTTGVLPSALGNTTNNWLGRSQYTGDAYFNGSLDDFRIYDRALSPGEVAELVIIPQSMWPSPADDATNIQANPILNWTPGDYADKHDVYLGTDFNAVNNAGSSSHPGLLYYTENYGSNFYPANGALDLDFNRTYYWRIDDVNDPNIYEGYVWSFSTGSYLGVDDMESYGDANTPGPPPPPGSRIWYTWKDGIGWTIPSPVQGNGSGSIVDPNTGIVHGVSRSLKLTYYNNASTGKKYYSEISADTSHLVIGQDWTKAGVKSLTLWFYGDASSSAEPFYVKVNDGTNTAKVNYPDPNELLEPKWHEWNIDLSKLGINLASVSEMAIGLGDETNTTTPGGSGVVYIDDIRLYPTRCLASIVNPDPDFDGDCIVDYDDIVTLGEQWLDSGLLVTPVAPGNTNLVGHWKFNDGPGSITALDSSVSANNGEVWGDAQWVGGHDGGALRLDGVDDYVELLIGTLISTLTKSTFSVWANFSNTGGSWQHLFDFGMDEIVYMYLTPRTGTTGPLQFAISLGSWQDPNEQRVIAPNTLPSGWHHIAVTISDPNTAGNRTIRLYLDGTQVGVNTQATLSPKDLGVTTNNWIGRSQFAVDAYYTGRVDDFRIYNRTLSAGEVASLAGKTQQFSEPYDLNVDGVVNFRDFANLAQDWLEELLWP